ncbi:MAG: PIG-L deacetylase family protein [Acidimicrobiales bacterium]
MTRPVLVTLHAHPDDEAIFTGGTIVRAVEAGWRVVLVVATDGGLGRSQRSVTAGLGALRRAETLAAATELGIDRVEFLGFGDSGFDPSPPEARPGATASARALVPGSLAAAHLDTVVAAVRRILADERAAALTSYDDNGVYGHVDHVLVHEIAVRSIGGTRCELYESTLSRQALRELRSHLVARGLVPGLWPPALAGRLGVEHGPSLVPVDVTRQLDRKLTAVAAHSSQVMEAPSFMGLPAGAFHHLLGTEWFRVARRGGGRFLDMLRRTDGAGPGSVPGSVPDHARISGSERGPFGQSPVPV